MEVFFVVSKRKSLMEIEVDVRGLLNGSLHEFPNVDMVSKEPMTDSMTVEKALQIIIRQMEVSGYRSRTISDYRLHVNHFLAITNAIYLNDISVDLIYKMA